MRGEIQTKRLKRGIQNMKKKKTSSEEREIEISGVYVREIESVFVGFD